MRSGLDHEITTARCHWSRIDDDVVHTGASRTLANRPLEALECLFVPLRLDLDGSVVTITDPTGQTFAPGRVVNEEPKADSLDAAEQDITSRGDHDETPIITPASAARLT